MQRVSHHSIIVSEQALKRGVVVMDLQSYRKMAAATVPTVQLHGKKARDLDKLVVEGLEEYYSGKLQPIRSLADLD